MNFYSDQIINEIIDKGPIENIIESIDDFKLQCKYVLTKYSYHTIHHRYTDWILNDKNVVIAFYCIDQEFCIYNCPSMLVYRKIRYDNEIRYYILFTCTKRSFRGQGYASKLLDELIKRIKVENDHRKNDFVIKIVLSSVEDAVLFYESYGFRWTRESIANHPLLMYYESYEEGKHYFILEMVLEW